MNSIVEIKLQCCLNIVTILPHNTSFSIATRKSVPKVGAITADSKFIFVSAVKARVNSLFFTGLPKNVKIN